MDARKRIAVVGGGVCGLSCAVQLIEHYKNHVEIILFSDKLSPFTTGDISAGIWSPFLCGVTPHDRVWKWTKASHDYFTKIWRDGDANEAGICLQPVYRVTATDKPLETYWTNIAYGAKNLSTDELTRLNRECNNNYKSGIQFVSFTSEPKKLLPYWFKKFMSAGGKFVEKFVTDLDELNRDYGPFDVIINAPGLGAKQIVGDTKLRAIRGQVIRVKAPWLYYTLLDDDGNYIIVNSETIVLGGTHQEDDYNTTPYKENVDYIRNGCHTLIPSLVNAEVIGDFVGLRPGRETVRLELEEKASKYTAESLKIIHNYGHGGSGVCFSWGCATEVTEIVQKLFGNKFNSKL